MDDDDLTGDGSQVPRLGFVGTLGRGRQCSGRESVLRVSCEFASTSVRPVILFFLIISIVGAQLVLI